jgi:hypothetical protein
MEAVSVWANWLPSMIAAGALGLVWADMRSFKKRNTAELKLLQTDFKKALYDENGTTKYVPRGDCERQATSCQKVLCSKIDELKTVQKDAQVDNRNQMKSINNFMGRFDQYIQDHP